MKYFILLIVVIFSLIIVQANDVNNQLNDSSIELNQSDGNISEIEIPNIEIIKFFPKEVKLGDVQFNIQVINNNNEVLDNVFAVISGSGFSTYDVINIEKLGAFEKDYLFVNGYFKESGNINLTIKINQYVYYQQISVIDVEDKNEKTDEEINKEILEKLSKQLEDLKENYTALELQLSEKEDNSYEVSGINLDELKRYLRTVQSDILSENILQAEINIRLAYDEYEYQKDRVDNAKVIPALKRLKENALVFSAIFGAILAFFALSELLKTNSKKIATGVSELARKSRINKKLKKEEKIKKVRS